MCVCLCVCISSPAVPDPNFAFLVGQPVFSRRGELTARPLQIHERVSLGVGSLAYLWIVLTATPGLRP